MSVATNTCDICGERLSRWMAEIRYRDKNDVMVCYQCISRANKLGIAPYELPVVE